MPSWRDSASLEAQNDMDGLLNATLPFARDQLTKRGTFVPYGAIVRNDDGGIELLAAYSGEKGAMSKDLLEMLMDGVRAKVESIRAYALVAGALIEGQRDAIRIDIEHRDGHAIAVAQPYVKRRFRRSMDFGDLMAAEGVRRVWS